MGAVMNWWKDLMLSECLFRMEFSGEFVSFLSISFANCSFRLVVIAYTFLLNRKVKPI